MFSDPLFAGWLNHSRGSSVWFRYNNGNVVVQNPDQETLMKMHKIADSRKARVQTHDYHDHILIDPNAPKAKRPSRFWNH